MNNWVEFDQNVSMRVPQFLTMCSWLWPLTFRSKNLISSSLSQVGEILPPQWFIRYPVHKVPVARTDSSVIMVVEASHCVTLLVWWWCWWSKVCVPSIISETTTWHCRPRARRSKRRWDSVTVHSSCDIALRWQNYLHSEYTIQTSL